MLLVDRRDTIKELSNKLSAISVAIFGFLLLNYFRFASDISIGGISIKNSPGISEILIVISSTLGIYVAALQANVTIVEGAIMHLAKRIYPKSLNGVLQASLIPDQNFGKYYPKNLHHLPLTTLHLRISRYVTLSYLVSIVFVLLLVIFTNLIILTDIWITSSIGIYSKIVSLYVLATSLVGFAILVITKLPMPFRDYSLLHQIEITRQLHPENVDNFLRKIYQGTNEDRENMRRLGYLKQNESK